MRATFASTIKRLLRCRQAWRQMHGTDESSYLAALVAVGRVKHYVPNITHVVDLGCGRGQWLTAFRDVLGCTVQGFDQKRFWPGWIKRSEYGRVNLAALCKFHSTVADLAISLEVAEHLPKAAAGLLVANLCGIAPAVLFSAATPGQGGWGHVNEQPHAYWDEKFDRCRYSVVTTFKDLNFPASPWYRDNMRLYLRDA